MCLFPKLMLNPKYLPNKKNNYNPPTPTDNRTKYVAVGCGNCIECRTQKAREWQYRLHKELENWKYSYFITLTFSNESLFNIMKETNITRKNGVATIATRRFLERWRKKYKKSVKHWLITELGHEGTERIHLHGIIFSNQEHTNEEIEKIWSYGWTYTGEYCNKRTINYIVKYVTKIDQDHKRYKPVILCSAGLGKNFISPTTQSIYKYKPNESKEFVYLPDGSKIAMPIYYRNKFYTENEREQLWIDRLDKDTMYVRGIEIPNVSTDYGQQQLKEILTEQQRQNYELGYGDDSNAWKWEEYNITRNMLQSRRKKRKKD